ncbi:glycoside hydrolase family 99-like domain-containing protein [Cyanobium sp. La Preciosa 7G6]|nr:glycoside hydrolase family 99-like domain-containing protein [Cyanobium sp. La Preciosa 7G6]MCP9835633.1 glycoside hydrolase family 99-like domain-containing protein [Cyanobium sp. La Preciosa 7G6]MCP9938399.1 glycoside hydrolase family 99-like domain-containing protein [Cyanobium sp. Aljojuca 7A6]
MQANKNSGITERLILQANNHYRLKDYGRALDLYLQFQAKFPDNRHIVTSNIERCKRRLALPGADEPNVPSAEDKSAKKPEKPTNPASMPANPHWTWRLGLDAFMLRGLEPTAPLAVVINVAGGLAWVKALAALEALDEAAHDLFLLGPDTLDFSSMPAGLSSLTHLGPADVTGNAHGFFCSAITGVFSQYEALLWVSPGDGGSEADDELLELVARGQAFRADAEWGYLATKLRSLGPKAQTEADQKLLDALRTALPRLGLSIGNSPLALPEGNALWLRPILLRAIKPSVRLFEMKVESKGDFPGRATVLGILAAVAREAGMETVSASRLATIPATVRDREIKAVAFYLPQFHPIPENDKWWGKGFTEWSNVTRTRQLFRHHYQPRVPADLGFYDLRLEDTQVAQAELARQFGIHGFCYYYYWFNGKKLLNQPIEQMARSSRVETGFCACWANENWSRNWDGQNRHVLMKQEYSLNSNIALIREMIPMMKDPRWVRFSGRPVMVVYRISIIPNWTETARAWREECRMAGLGEIHLCAVRFGLETLQGKPQEHGLDSYVLFPPHETRRKNIRDEVHDLHKEFGGEIFDYTAVVDGDLQKYDGGYEWPVHRGAMLGWDNTARRLTDARIFHGATPYGFRRWMKGIVEQEARFNSGSESLIFINAWNEWAEGTYLEPDQRWGTAYLEAFASSIQSVPGAKAVLVPKRKSPRSMVQGRLAVQGSPLDNGGAALAPPAWHEGQRRHDATLPTVLLCAHISGHHLFGGERSLLDVLHALSTLPLNVVVTLPSGNNTAYLDGIASLSIGSYVFSYPQWMNNRENYAWLSNKFSDIIARHGVDIVHANTIVLSEAVLAARRMGRQVLIHVRELISLDEPLRERMAMRTSDIIAEVLKRADWIVANSQATATLFSKGGRTLYVPNAVNISDLDMSNKFGTTIKFGIVSSNIPKKGVADFVEVARRAAALVPSARFVVIGPLNDQIRKWSVEVEQGKRPDNLAFLGYRDNPRAAMSELNVLLNLSHFAESFGRTLAEGAAARRPVIAYEWGALRELVNQGENGILVPYRDIDGVVDAVVTLCNTPSLIHKMGDAGRSFISKEFSQESLRDALARGYEQIFGLPMRGQATLEAPNTTPHIPAITRVGCAQRTSIIIPVYNAPDEVNACISSVLRHTDLSRNRVLVIDDGSSDPAVTSVLSIFEGHPSLTIRRNNSNIGYTRTINAAITETDADDVVLLNSDTIVTPKWLEGLLATSYCRAKVATVTAMSDNAGAFSFPKFNEACFKPDHLSHDEYALLILQATQACVPPKVPTGSGFCMLIRRDVIRKCGLFDCIAFPRGYGEENDFCMRALKAGWINLVSPWSFVYHVRSASFKGEKVALVKAGVDMVTKRYPEYASLVKEAFAAPEMAALRQASLRVASENRTDIIK